MITIVCTKKTGTEKYHFENKEPAIEQWLKCAEEVESGKASSLYSINSDGSVTPYKKKTKKMLAEVAFKFYDYKVPADTKVGDSIVVIAGGKPVELRVLRVHPLSDMKADIEYVDAEEVKKAKK